MPEQIVGDFLCGPVFPRKTTHVIHRSDKGTRMETLKGSVLITRFQYT